VDRPLKQPRDIPEVLQQNDSDRLWGAHDSEYDPRTSAGSSHLPRISSKHGILQLISIELFWCWRVDVDEKSMKLNRLIALRFYNFYFKLSQHFSSAFALYGRSTLRWHVWRIEKIIHIWNWNWRSNNVVGKASSSTSSFAENICTLRFTSVRRSLQCAAQHSLRPLVHCSPLLSAHNNELRRCIYSHSMTDCSATHGTVHQQWSNFYKVRTGSKRSLALDLRVRSLVPCCKGVTDNVGHTCVHLHSNCTVLLSGLPALLLLTCTRLYIVSLSCFMFCDVTCMEAYGRANYKEEG
jgi:hypothetical protein